MKKDIRDLFDGNEGSDLELPKGHRQEFLEKLKKSKSRKSKRQGYVKIYRVAAVLIVFLSIGMVVFNPFYKDESEVVSKSPIELQIKNIEKGYLISIGNEWKSFLKLTKDEKLIERYERKLESLDAEYREILKVFKNDSNNISVIESLIENLKTRLKLLKNIQAHIKLLNEKREENETITI